MTASDGEDCRETEGGTLATSRAEWCPAATLGRFPAPEEMVLQARGLRWER